jgi:hypothetical protein
MTIKSQTSEQFWVSNISDMNVSLSDLGLTIPARKTVNLLDKRHYSFSQEELALSAVSGSIFKKKSKVVVRKVPPVFETRQLLEVDYNALAPSRRRSIVQIREERHEELEVSDDMFAEQMADLTDEKLSR